MKEPNVFDMIDEAIKIASKDFNLNIDRIDLSYSAGIEFKSGCYVHMSPKAGGAITYKGIQCYTSRDKPSECFVVAIDSGIKSGRNGVCVYRRQKLSAIPDIEFCNGKAEC